MYDEPNSEPKGIWALLFFAAILLICFACVFGCGIISGNWPID
jgi:hypothetical protein